MLPNDCRWIDSDEGSFLHHRFACIASVRADGSVLIRWYAEVRGQAASRAQGKRHIERWIAVRGLPPGNEARRISRDRRAGVVPAPPPHLAESAPGCSGMRMPEPPDEMEMLPSRADW